MFFYSPSTSANNSTSYYALAEDNEARTWKLSAAYIMCSDKCFSYRNYFFVDQEKQENKSFLHNSLFFR